MKTKLNRPSTSAGLGSDELGVARQSWKILSRHADKQGRLIFQISSGKKKESVIIPAAAARLVKDVLTGMSGGHGAIPDAPEEELTTQQAADLLNVSRPYLIGLLEGGEIPFRKVGTHRRIDARDILNYKRAIDAERSRVLDELAKQAQDLNMGY